MTREYKDLLIKDLCVRVPYGVKYVRSSWNYDTDQELPVIETLECVDKDGYINYRRVYTVDDIKVYLFPLSSMTEEQKKEYRKVCELDTEILSKHPMDETPFPALYNSQDWLSTHHFDFRGLIEKGLAIDATGKGIY